MLTYLLKIFLQRLSRYSISLLKYLHQFSVFDCIHCKRLVLRPLLLSTDLTFYVDLWRCKGFQPLVSVCSLCLLVFFMKVLSSVLSNSSANDTYIKFADDKSRECAERIIDIHIIFVLVSHILRNEACSTLVSTQLVLSDSLCCYSCLIPISRSAMFSFRLWTLVGRIVSYSLTVPSTARPWFFPGTSELFIKQR